MGCMEYHCNNCGEVNWDGWRCPACGKDCGYGYFDEYVGNTPPPNRVINPKFKGGSNKWAKEKTIQNIENDKKQAKHFQDALKKL